MHAKTRKLPFDVARAGADIRQFCAGKALDDYGREAMLRAAVERKFEIVGEAMSRLRALDAETFTRITAAAATIAFRHRLIHGYDQVDDGIVWETVHHKLPVLLAEVSGLLEAPGEDPDGV